MPGNEESVCLLLKALYGLCQVPNYWQDDIISFLIKIGFIQCELDHCTYFRKNPDNKSFTAVYVHVDDFAITGNEIINFKKELSSK